MKIIDAVQRILDRVAERESPALSEAQRRLAEADRILALTDEEILRRAGGKS